MKKGEGKEEGGEDGEEGGRDGRRRKEWERTKGKAETVEVEAVMSDYVELGMAIGTGGSNVRTACELTGAFIKCIVAEQSRGGGGGGQQGGGKMMMRERSDSKTDFKARRPRKETNLSLWGSDDDSSGGFFDDNSGDGTFLDDLLREADMDDGNTGLPKVKKPSLFSSPPDAKGRPVVENEDDLLKSLSSLIKSTKEKAGKEEGKRKVRIDEDEEGDFFSLAESWLDGEDGENGGVANLLPSTKAPQRKPALSGNERKPSSKSTLEDDFLKSLDDDDDFDFAAFDKDEDDISSLLFSSGEGQKGRGGSGGGTLGKEGLRNVGRKGKGEPAVSVKDDDDDDFWSKLDEIVDSPKFQSAKERASTTTAAGRGGRKSVPDEASSTPRARVKKSEAMPSKTDRGHSEELFSLINDDEYDP